MAAGDASLTPMTALQQGLIHLGLVLIAIVAIVVLAATGDGNNTVYGLILAISGFGNIGAAALPSVGAPAATPVPPATKGPAAG